jgi:hypothetical protein
MPAFVTFVGDQRVGVLEGRHRRDVDDRAGLLPPHDRQRVLAGHDRAAQVDRRDPVVGLLGQVLDRLVAAADAHPDIVVQYVDAAPAPHRLCHRRGKGGLARYVGGEGNAVRALFRGQRRGLLGRGEVAVDGENLRTLLGEAQHRGAAVADAFAGALPGADDHRDFSRETHRYPSIGLPGGRMAPHAGPRQAGRKDGNAAGAEAWLGHRRRRFEGLLSRS